MSTTSGKFRCRNNFGLVALAVAIACGGSSTAPDNEWIGTWDLISVNGQSLPADAPILLGSFNTTLRVYRRTLIVSQARAAWDDSSVDTSAQSCFLRDNGSVAPCDESGTATYTWTVHGGYLVLDGVVQHANYYAPVPVTFERQLDGTLVRTDQGIVEVYQKE